MRTETANRIGDGLTPDMRTTRLCEAMGIVRMFMREDIIRGVDMLAARQWLYNLAEELGIEHRPEDGDTGWLAQEAYDYKREAR